MSDRKNFEALLDEYVHRYVEALDATDGVGTEEAEQARAAVLAAYDAAGREGQYLADGMRFKLAATRSGAAAEFRSFPAELAGKWVALVDATDGKHLCAHPAPKSDAAADSSRTTEQHIALREAHCIAAGDAFWKARPNGDTTGARIAFDAGFVRGFDAAAALAASPARVGEGEK